MFILAINLMFFNISRAFLKLNFIYYFYDGADTFVLLTVLADRIKKPKTSRQLKKPVLGFGWR
jgi:hypothetical protein